jgi:hypothetical protein
MTRLGLSLRKLALPVICAALCLRMQDDAARPVKPAQMAFPAAMPQTVVWAWEEPEDLRSASAAKTGVAFLAETLLLGTRQGEQPSGEPPVAAISMVSRHQPLYVAPGASVMAVVRVVALGNFRDSDALREQTAAALAEVARRPGLRALQIDFDATRSQHEFYAALLRELRPQMPVGMPLSITALVSWCAATPGSKSDWMSALPIDEAVPMFFRMGGATRPGDAKSGYPLREPLCRGSVGIATDESWPDIHTGQRVYIFAPRPWTLEQLAALDGIARGRRDAPLSFRSGLRAVNDSGLPNLRERDRAQADRDTPEENLP